MQNLIDQNDLPDDMMWICEKCLALHRRHVRPIGCKWRDYESKLCPNLSNLIHRLNGDVNGGKDD